MWAYLNFSRPLLDQQSLLIRTLSQLRTTSGPRHESELPCEMLDFTLSLILCRKLALSRSGETLDFAFATLQERLVLWRCGNLEGAPKPLVRAGERPALPWSCRDAVADKSEA